MGWYCVPQEVEVEEEVVVVLGIPKEKTEFERDRKLEQSSGELAHQIKTEALGTNKHISKYDLYKDSLGNIVVKGKGGVGEAIPTGLKLN